MWVALAPNLRYIRRMTSLRAHPGEVLLERFLRPHGMSVDQLAERIEISVETLQQIIEGTRRLKPYVAAALAEEFGTSAVFWTNLQADRDLGFENC